MIFASVLTYVGRVLLAPRGFSGAGRPGTIVRPGMVALLLLVAVANATAQDRTMVVYLPSAPSESATRVAAGIAQLASHLSDRTGMRIEAKAFRRAEDASAYLAASPNEVAIVVSEPSFLMDLPAGFDIVPSFRFVRGGRETGRKIIVVRRNDRATSLAGLRGRALATAIGSGRGASAYLARIVFGGERQNLLARNVARPEGAEMAGLEVFEGQHCHEIWIRIAMWIEDFLWRGPIVALIYGILNSPIRIAISTRASTAAGVRPRLARSNFRG